MLFIVERAGRGQTATLATTNDTPPSYTNAHLVHYAEEVEVQFRPGTKKYPAVVVGNGPAMDLAVLTIEDKEFFKKHPPLPRAKKTARVQDTTVVFGFPIGGNNLSVTRGTVSRIE